MKSDDALPDIECPIDKFEAAEREIKQLSAAINDASSPHEKGQLAHHLYEQVSTLLACRAYEPDNVNCRLCREISTLRRRTASLIEKAAALDWRNTVGGAEA